jgi:endonuclease/exonuclease/phosphatase family metal-dependent hydrolase
MNDQFLTVATINAFHDLPRFRHLGRRLELIAAAIASARPHLVAIQEVARASACGDMGERLGALVNRFAGASEYSLHYVPADGAGEGEYAFDEGVAILSRLPGIGGPPEILRYRAQVELAAVVGGTHYRLPDDRIAIRMRFETGARRAAEFFATHLTDRDDAGPDGVAIRTAQVAELARWASTSSDPESLVIVAGDFNDVPESEAIRGFIAAGFTDVWTAAGNGDGFTNNHDDIDLEDARASHDRRIDYLFCRAPSGSDCKVADARLFVDRPNPEPGGRWLWASDHIGVLAGFSF